MQTLEIKKDQTQHFLIEADPQSEIAPIAEPELQDEIGPTVVFQSPEDGKEYTSDQIVPIVFSISDNVSKKEDSWTEQYLDDYANGIFEGSLIDLSKLSPGTHTFWVDAWDQLDNWSNTAVTFMVKKAVLPGEPPAETEDGKQGPPTGNDGTGSGNIDSGLNNQIPGEVVVVPTQPAVAQENSDSPEKKSAKHKKKKQVKKDSEKRKFIQGGGVTKSDEKIKVLFSSSFNLSKKAEEQQNLFYQNLEENLKAQLIALEENSGQAENFALEAQTEELLPNFFTPWALGNSKRLFNFPEKPTILGATWSGEQLVKFSESKSSQRKIEKNRWMLLIDFLLALLAVIFFVRSFFKNYARSKTSH